MRTRLAFLLLACCVASPTVAATLAPGDILALDAAPTGDRNLYKVDPATGVPTLLAALPHEAGGLVAETADTVLFATSVAGVGWQIVRVSLVTGARSVISSPPVASPFGAFIGRFALGSDGRIVATVPGGIADVDPTTGEITLRVPGPLDGVTVAPNGDVYASYTTVGDSAMQIVSVDLAAGTYALPGEYFDWGKIAVDGRGNRFVYTGCCGAFDNSMFRTGGSPDGARGYFAHGGNPGGRARDYALDASGNIVAGGTAFPNPTTHDLLADISLYDAATAVQTPIGNVPGGVSAIAIYAPEPGAPLLLGAGVAILVARRRTR